MAWQTQMKLEIQYLSWYHVLGKGQLKSWDVMQYCISGNQLLHHNSDFMFLVVFQWRAFLLALKSLQNKAQHIPKCCSSVRISWRQNNKWSRNSYSGEESAKSFLKTKIGKKYILIKIRWKKHQPKNWKYQYHW